MVPRKIWIIRKAKKELAAKALKTVKPLVTRVIKLISSTNNN